MRKLFSELRAKLSSERQQKNRDDAERILDELKPPACPLCSSTDTELLNDGASGRCGKCGAAWANYITMTIKVGDD